jgi:hypothetical protein
VSQQVVPPNIDEQGLASKVASGIEALPDTASYNAVHLRMEIDAHAWHDRVGGPEAFFQRYTTGMHRAGLDASAPVYFATGLIRATREAPAELTRLLHYAGQVECLKERCQPNFRLNAHRLNARRSHRTCLTRRDECVAADHTIMLD